MSGSSLVSYLRLVPRFLASNAVGWLLNLGKNKMLNAMMMNQYCDRMKDERVQTFQSMQRLQVVNKLRVGYRVHLKGLYRTLNFFCNHNGT